MDHGPFIRIPGLAKEEYGVSIRAVRGLLYNWVDILLLMLFNEFYIIFKRLSMECVSLLVVLLFFKLILFTTICQNSTPDLDFSSPPAQNIEPAFPGEPSPGGGRRGRPGGAAAPTTRPCICIYIYI